MGLLAASLLILGIPQLYRSVGRLEAGLDSSEEVKPEELRRAAEQAEALDIALADPRGSLRGGLLRLRLALPTGGPPDRAELESAAADLERGLSRSPADAQAWAALGHTDLALDRPEAAVKALSASLFASRTDPYLNSSWCILGISLWPLLDDEGKARISQEIRRAWRDRRALVLTWARADAQYAVLLRNALENSEKAEFDLRLRSASGDH
jgi:hypothetical protein